MKRTFLIFLMAITLFSCKDSTIEPETYFNGKISKIMSTDIPISPLNPILEDVVNPIFDKDVSTDILLSFQTESEAQQYMEQSLINSKNYLSDMGFTDQEIIDEFGSVDDPRVIYLAIITKAIIENPSGFSGSKVIQCALEAFGVKEIVDAFASKAITEGTKKAAVKAVGKMAAKYGLGYISTAIMVGEFVYCMANSWTPEGGSDDDDGSGTPGTGNPGLSFPENYLGEYFFTEHPEYIHSTETDKYSTNLYYDNGKYYFNPTKTCLLPDGYYFNNSDNKYYHVINGKVVAINNIPNPPCPTCPTPVEYYYPNPFNCNAG